MSIEQSTAETGVKIGPVPASRKHNLAGVLCGLSLAAWFVANGKPWMALPYLVLICVGVALQFALRTLGVELTPEAAVIHGRHRRTVPWLQVQSVVAHVNSNGSSAVQLILENGEPVQLPFPKTLWRKGDTGFQRDMERIDRWWLAHRGESWQHGGEPTEF